MGPKRASKNLRRTLAMSVMDPMSIMRQSAQGAKDFEAWVQEADKVWTRAETRPR